jgi:sigma-E factor negative regulatory protein RseA
MNPQIPHPTADLQADDKPDARQWLSALADGDGQAAAEACRLWRDDAEARRSWHAWQLIGDVMRSDELASPPARDAAFLGRLREKLAVEPVPLAPEPLRRRQGWLVPAAAVAGFVAVAGVLVLARGGAPGFGPGGGSALASASGPKAGGNQLLAETDPTAARRVGGPALLRDDRLDEYLRAHQQPVRHGMPLVLGDGGLRKVDDTVPAR